MSRIIAREGSFFVRADKVRIEDALDFQGDQYADPDTFANPEYEPEPGETADGFRYEMSQVESVTRETPDCIVISTTGGAFGFPADHEIEISLEGTPDLRSWNDCSAILHPQGYRHTAGNRYAKLVGKGMVWASIQNDGPNDHYIVYHD